MVYIAIVLGILALLIILWLYAQMRKMQNERVALLPEQARLTQALQDRERELHRTQVEVEELRQSLRQQQTDYAALQARSQVVAEQLRESKEQTLALSEQLKSQFGELAAKIFEERSEKLSQHNEESLKPLREDLKRFGEQVRATYENEARERFSLQHIIRELMDRSGAMSRETSELIRALKGDSKVQGDWGEMILENILEHSGLTRDREYFVQETLRDTEGRIVQPEGNKGGLRPDVLVRYPNGGVMIIDSKVSLTAYSNYVAAVNDEERATFAKAHLASVRKHIDELGEKKYHHYLDTAPDFVMLFIPNDPAYALALQETPTLWEYAYKKGVILINGTNLIAALRMAQDMWQRDRQVKNVEEIVRRAAALYDKFCTYSETLLDAEKKLNAASESLSKAKGQLMTGRGNLIDGLDKLKEMGIAPSKNIPLSMRPNAE